MYFQCIYAFACVFLVHWFLIVVVYSNSYFLQETETVSACCHSTAVLFGFFKATRPKRRRSRRAVRSNVHCRFFSASFCPENKCCLCPLEAADLSWTHRQLFSLICFHTKHFISSLHLILSLRCTALHFRSRLSSCKQHTHHSVKFTYYPRRPGWRHAGNVTRAAVPAELSEQSLWTHTSINMLSQPSD